MRKRSGRPPRHAAVPNETIDDALALDFMALALLTVLLRHRDGWEITLAKIGEKYGYGRDALANAMGLLQVARYVVKIRMMSVQGNQWSTEVYVFDTPATDEEVAVLLAEAARLPEVRRASVIEPTAAAIAYAKKRQQKLAPKHGRTAPTMPVPRVPENPDSGSTSGNGASSQAVPECGFSRQSGDPTVNKKTVGKKTREKTDAPAGRSPVDGRSPSTSGSSGREDEGGSAASGKAPSSSSQKPQGGKRHSRADLATVDEVLSFLPAAIPADQVRLPVVADAVLSAMASDGRSIEEMGQRIQYRWIHHRFAEKVITGGLENPVGTAIALVRPLRRGDRYACADTRCENGRHLDTGEECPLCAVRAADWAAARKRERGEDRPAKVAPAPKMPPQRAAKPVLVDCANPVCPRSIPVAAGPLCGNCLDQQEAEAVGAALAALAAQWAADEADAAEQDAAAARIIAELEQEDVERAARMQAKAEEQAATEAERQQLAAEEDARLRAEFAAQHPELASYSAQGPAPF